MGSSRLDRLFTLLATSTSPSTLTLASQQLAQVVRSHPEELCRILSQLHPLLHASQWETRLAAVQALTAVLADYPTVKSEDEGHAPGGAWTGPSKLYTFATFRLADVMAASAPLVSSRGQEFNPAEGLDLSEQKKAINQKFGLSMTSRLTGGESETDLITEDDLKVETPPTPGLVSARERNRLKRALSKQKSHVQSTQKKAKKEAKLYRIDRSPADPNQWLLQPFCLYLFRDLFDEAWEIRHGAATALREVVRLQGRHAGCHRKFAPGDNEPAHRAWLEDVSLRLITVIAKDRFGDFVSDQVVAPVRESSAQALASVVNLMEPEAVGQVVEVVLLLLDNPDWQCRHGGLLGIKYILANRQDLVSDILPRLYPAIFKGLNDSVDDVVGVAAASLVPVVRELTQNHQDRLQALTDRLWDALKIIDDLTSSTHSIMQLLSEILKNLVEFGQVEQLGLVQNGCNGHSDSSHFASKVVRLLPFMSHSSSLVRRATLATLNTLTEHQELAKAFLPVIVKDLSLHLFQRAILEHQAPNLSLLEQIWSNMTLFTPLGPLLMATCPMYGSWVAMIIQPPNWPIPPHLLLPETVKAGIHQYLGGPDVQHLVDPVEKDRFVVRGRYLAAKMLGKLAGFIRTPVPGMDYSKDALTPLQMFVTKILMPNLNSSCSAYQRMTMSLIVSEWYEQHDEQEVPEVLRATFNRFLVEAPSYDETRQAATQLQNETVDFIALLKHYKMKLVPELVQLQPTTFTIDQVQLFLTQTDFKALFATNPKLKTKLNDSLYDRKNTLLGSLNRIANDQAMLTVMNQAANAGASVSLGAFPDKLNPVIKPLMESIKREKNELLQALSADKLVRVLEYCHEQQMLPPLEKVIKNLVNFVSSDPLVTPSFNPEPSATENRSILILWLREARSSSLKNSNKSDRKSNSKAKSSSYSNSLSIKDTLQVNGADQSLAKGKRKSPSTSNGTSPPPSSAAVDPQEDQEASERLSIQSRGSRLALEKIIRHFHVELFTKLPKLYEMTLKSVLAVMRIDQDQSSDLVIALRGLEVAIPVLALDLQSSLIESLPHLAILLESPFASVRHMSSRCVAELAKVLPVAVMVSIMDQILPLLSSDLLAHRQGAMECLACLIEKLDIQILPYIALLIVPCMGRMSDPDQDVRLLASNTFAVLIRLIPLDGAVPEPENLPKQLVERKAHEQRFIHQLMNTSQLEDFSLPIKIHATLRSYQKDGLNWLAFLNRYKLHGILCDDMGLGKTLQTICMLASDHFELQNCQSHPGVFEPSSLVICPPTLCNHWYAEILKFAGNAVLRPLIYAGPLATRVEIRSLFQTHNVVITSYDVLRNDLSYFSGTFWNYVILDEGHVIKNGKTKTTVAIKSLLASHRLILSGTPIQNSVLELWSLFDFLMPGFLGTEKQFASKYSRPIVASRDPKCSPKDQEAGALAMEALHKQALPFILRRMKEDVLDDLPPKITQDYYCDLSPIQVKLYEDFARSQSTQHMQNGNEALNLSKKDPAPVVPVNKPHIFQALQYLRKVCNHPKLVLCPKHPEYEAVMGMLHVTNSHLDEIGLSGKLPALRDLLLQCGIGAQSSSSSEVPVVVQHRALVFFQLKSMMSIVENDLLKKLMPTVTYLRLDGSVPANARQGIVDKFNNDISYDLLLLSTSVGGLGLNLTGADTVIFVEHDWNPMKDLQAMDRAHRIGQKKVVNVYRLITRNTIEEKILGLQKFKMITANTVISSDNASLHSMATDQIFDLFSLEDQSPTDPGESRDQQQGIKALLDNMPELWDERQYEDEYEINAYMSKLEPLSNGSPLPSTSKL